ncbi:MAG: hypothetical protein HYV09_27450 [Deltaproteobacteria bacterium]|nr:hypothetical protein [Deltaproteobacteria bacterium]
MHYARFHRAVSLGAALGALLSISCSGATTSDEPSSEWVDPADVGTGSSAVSGLPCDVADLLLARCTSCHSNPPVGGAPYALVTYDDLARSSPANPGQTVAQRSLIRMEDAKSPMPPGGATAAEGATLKAWIGGGMPRVDCSSTADAGPSPWTAPVGCVSGSRWTRGDDGSSSMHPGRACIACHKSEWEAPKYSIAGTVYSSAHEEDDCNAKSTDVSGTHVVITGADGRTFDLVANAAGNFFTRAIIALPYRAKVVKDGRERVMSAPQSNGDCNACHTVAGVDGAPGRVLAP